MIAIVGICCFIAAREVRRLRIEARDSSCQGRLAQIALAIQNYRDATGEFPPICVRDKDGTPLYSWRVLLLPSFGLDDIYERFDRMAAWNSPKNSALAKEVSERVAPLFRCPNDRPGHEDWATFLALTTKDGHNPERLTVTGRGPMPTRPVIVDVHGSGIHWMAPEDMPVKEAQTGLVRRNPESGVVNFLTGDGRIGSLTDNELIFSESETEMFERFAKGLPTSTNP